MQPNSDARGKSGAKGLLMLSISRFFSHEPNMSAVLPYINGSSPISLRMIDWFVTNYARRHNTCLVLEGGAHVNVYLSYRTQLKAYSKQQFDPFRRRDRITYYYSRDSCIETTIGQLNFFRWLLQNQVLDYIVENACAIEHDMNANAGAGAGASSQVAGDVAAAESAARPQKRHAGRPKQRTLPGISRLAAHRTIQFA